MAAFRMDRRMLIVGGGIALVISVLALVFVVLPAGKHDESGARPVGTQATGVVVRGGEEPDEAANLTEIVRTIQMLPGQFADGDGQALSPAARARFTDLQRALPAGTALSVDRSSYRRTGAVASVTVTASRAGQADAVFSLVLVRDDGRWRVSGSYPLGGA